MDQTDVLHWNSETQVAGIVLNLQHWKLSLENRNGNIGALEMEDAAEKMTADVMYILPSTTWPIHICDILVVQKINWGKGHE